jgi:hypothetical protein
LCKKKIIDQKKKLYSSNSSSNINNNREKTKNPSGPIHEENIQGKKKSKVLS